MRIPARLRGPIAFWALAGLAVLVSHDAIFLAQLGPGERLTAALRSVGHDYWGAASLALVIIAVLAGSITLARLVRLGRQAAAVGATCRARRPHPARLFPMWARLAAMVAFGFAIQENLEHFFAHGHVIGTGALIGPEYPLALPVIAIVSFVAALGACLLAANERELVAAIAAALAQRPRPQRVAVRPPQQIAMRLGGVLARFGAGRAPPSMVYLPG
jgi:hypothetical protein